jgi:hypothetical protein
VVRDDEKSPGSAEHRVTDNAARWIADLTGVDGQHAGGELQWTIKPRDGKNKARNADARISVISLQRTIVQTVGCG